MSLGKWKKEEKRAESMAKGKALRKHSVSPSFISEVEKLLLMPCPGSNPCGDRPHGSLEDVSVSR